MALLALSSKISHTSLSTKLKALQCYLSQDKSAPIRGVSPPASGLLLLVSQLEIMKLLFVLICCVLIIGISQSKPAPPRSVVGPFKDSPKRIAGVRAAYPYKRRVVIPDGRSLRQDEDVAGLK
ncbi:hypothetical protein Bpfe_003566 [Biomphalaria pfeifferi]|uniref:Uncharacterized protein n=1 Tax=Biomphalaria pfeifferi TaxID=112525 RepID=A0AAD8FKI1_BIOPF|nr:hypothetical protein Bpfe_003566 [Biomphalaria pfeifferi]